MCDSGQLDDTYDYNNDLVWVLDVLQMPRRRGKLGSKSKLRAPILNITGKIATSRVVIHLILSRIVIFVL